MSVIKHFTSWLTPGIFNLIYLIVNYIINIHKLSSENWGTYAGPMTFLVSSGHIKFLTVKEYPSVSPTSRNMGVRGYIYKPVQYHKNKSFDQLFVIIHQMFLVNPLFSLVIICLEDHFTWQLVAGQCLWDYKLVLA